MKRVYLGLTLILLLACLLRFWQLGVIPEGFHADEAAFGYNAYSLLLTGRDEYGKFLPLILKSFGDYKGAVYAYLDIPFIKFLGLTELAVRLPSAIFGVLLVGLSFLVIRKLTQDESLALITAALMAISPLAVFLSRVQSDPLIAVFFLILGFYLFLLWLEKKKAYLLILNCFFWLVSLFTYASPRTFLPLFIPLVLVFFWKKLRRKEKKLTLIGYSIVFLVALFLIFGPQGARLEQLAVFKTPEVILPLEEKIREDKDVPILWVRFFHNKPLDYTFYLIKNYFRYFDFEFLFMEGGFPERERTPCTGILYLIELPFVIFGLFLLLKKRIKWGYFITSWLFLVPATLALAVHESPNVHRFFMTILSLELISAYGLLQFLKKIRGQKLFWPIVVVTLLIFLQSTTLFLHQLFVHQPVHAPRYRGYAFKPLISALDKHSPQFNKVTLTKAVSSPYIYLLFYQKYDPKKYQSLGSPRDLDYSGFDKYYFVPEDCPLSEENIKRGKVQEGILYVNKGDCTPPPQSSKVLEKIDWRDSSKAFQILFYVPAE